jgi:hypothetical protein
MSSIYAEPRVVTNPAQCIFYHTMDIPGYGHVQGDWDLRGHERQYLGNVDFAGKRVLEVGTASGYLPMYFQPDAKTVGSKETWWSLPPKLIVAFLGVLGFEETTVTYHKQLSSLGRTNMYTVVGRRTTPFQN